jgi:hypothetical protein
MKRHAAPEACKPSDQYRLNLLGPNGFCNFKCLGNSAVVGTMIRAFIAALGRDLTC